MIEAGCAFLTINGRIGASVQGASVDNVARGIRDDLEANALILRRGDSGVMLVSCDVVTVPDDVVQAARDEMAAAAGIDPRAVLIAGTHTHAGPVVVATNIRKPVDEEYLETLKGRLVEVARRAAESVLPVRVGWGAGRAEIGYNRRHCWADGSHTMHGDATREDFTGLEGPDDHSHLALSVEDADGNVLAILHHATSHPTIFYGADFYSAGFPGEARRLLRETFGPIPVLFFNGAQGDIMCDNPLGRHDRHESRECRLRRIANILAGETLRVMHDAPMHDDIALAHTFEDMPVDVRLPDPERLAWARATLERYEKSEEVSRVDRMVAFGVDLLQRQFGDNPRDTLAIHALRIGDLAIATQPCELYCQLGLNIKRRSPAHATAVFGLTDGNGGYCPTIEGILGGGYSGEPYAWARLAPETGYRIVDTASRLIREVWRAEDG